MSNFNSPYTLPENGLTDQKTGHQPVIAQASEDPGQMVTSRSGGSHSAVYTPWQQNAATAQSEQSAHYNTPWQQNAATAQSEQSAHYNTPWQQSEAATRPVRTTSSTQSSTQSQAFLVHIDPSLDHLRQEEQRLATYNDSWPSNVPVTPRDLAAAGLYCIRVGDMVRCIFCKGTLKQWDQGDDPMTEHRKHFPQCPFVCGREVGNIRMPVNVHRSSSFPIEYRQDMFTSKETPMFYDYEDYDRRLRSFNGIALPVSQTAKEMAHSGFFYTGPDDAVKCFWCGGALKAWKPIDRPLSEHIRWMPHCKFAQKLSKPSSTPRRVEGNALAMANQQAYVPSHPQTTHQLQNNQQGVNILPISVELENMSIDENLRPDDERAMDVLEVSGNIHGQDTSGMKSLSGSHCSVSGNNGLVPDNLSQKSSVLHTEDLVEENRRLKSALECKICMSMNVNTLFLPCGHLVCCDECAPSCSLCPMCRVEVRGTIRTYL